MTPEKLGGHSQTMELILRDIFDFFSFLATTTLTNKRVKFWINLLIFKVGAPYKKIIVHKWLPILWIPHAPNTIVTSRDANINVQSLHRDRFFEKKFPLK